MNGLRLMAVDDDEFIHVMIRGMLDREQDGLRWPYHAALSLVEGLDALESFGAEIVLLDLHFTNQEDATLKTAIATIHAFDQKAAVIILTGYSNPDLHAECVRNGALDFIDKNTLFNLETTCSHCGKDVSLLKLSTTILKERCYNAARQWNERHHAK